ncbi:hypothetical protein [Actinomadura sp. BRA 177]|uniref:effector-associated constant component EACC1 n=1 Tax=Actinomadura sp. BRA 177 TaxID=2745202 RepID=UPI001595D47D|nr:hypothetical protein [Actinomadura sp. BRA 177]NVI86166.1 hypothetical protein [Actinomadura sp. BRA 177]
MELEFTFPESANPEEDARSLLAWLQAEDDLRPSSIGWQRADIAPGTMGAVTEVLVMSLGSGGAGAVLARSLPVWFQTRRSDVKVKLKTARGSCEVNAKNVPSPESLLKEIRSLLETE